MTAFETWATGLLNYEYVQEMIHQREYQVSKMLPADELKARWQLINYTPPKVKPPLGQLKLF